MKNFGIFVLGAVVATAGFLLLDKPNNTTIDNNNQQQNGTIQPGDTSHVGIDYAAGLELGEHTVNISSDDPYGMPLVVTETFNGTLQDFLSLPGWIGTSQTNYDTNSEAVTNGQFAETFEAGFNTERKTFVGEIELSAGTTRTYSYTDIIEHDTNFTLGEVKIFWNGEEVTLDDISAMTHGSYLSIAQVGVINYDDQTIDMNYVVFALDYGATYQSEDGTVVLHIRDINTSGDKSYFSDAAINDGAQLWISSYVGQVGIYDEETGTHTEFFGMSAGANVDGEYVSFAIKMVDYDTFEYNGITLTKVVA
ncbi:MAG: hypothetical protein ACLRFR_02505 [Clostridia bacterium]